MKKNKEYILAILKALLEDCNDFSQWDTQDPDNWLAMSDNIEDVIDYVGGQK